MILKYGGQKVPRGAYWDRKTWTILIIENNGDVLPGEPGHPYWRLSAIELLVFALFVSILFVVFVPFVGIAVFLSAGAVCVLTFLAQKILCRIIRDICRMETWMCHFVKRYFCKTCGQDCDDTIAMLVKAFIYGIIYLLGALTVVGVQNLSR